jgi:hypothetical protein
MLQFSLFSITLAILILAGWYWWFLRSNRRCAVRILHWLEEAIAAHGEISGVEWISPSHFRARLQLPGCPFHQPSLDARLAPRQLPLKWALWRWRGRQETLTFEANLSCPPHLSLEIGRTRCTGVTRRWMRGTGAWPTQAVAPLFISTEPDWEREVFVRMSEVASMRAFEWLGLSFQSQEPHFSVMLSLNETLKRPSGDLLFFDTLRELAEGSPTSRM